MGPDWPDLAFSTTPARTPGVALFQVSHGSALTPRQPPLPALNRRDAVARGGGMRVEWPRCSCSRPLAQVVQRPGIHPPGAFLFLRLLSTVRKPPPFEIDAARLRISQPRIAPENRLVAHRQNRHARRISPQGVNPSILHRLGAPLLPRTVSRRRRPDSVPGRRPPPITGAIERAIVPDAGIAVRNHRRYVRPCLA